MLDLSLCSVLSDSQSVSPPALWRDKTLYQSLSQSLGATQDWEQERRRRRNISILCEGCWLYERQQNIAGTIYCQARFLLLLCGTSQTSHHANYSINLLILTISLVPSFKIIPLCYDISVTAYDDITDCQYQ